MMSIGGARGCLVNLEAVSFRPALYNGHVVGDELGELEGGELSAPLGDELGSVDGDALGEKLGELLELAEGNALEKLGLRLGSAVGDALGL
jgi:hypothetical protein